VLVLSLSQRLVRLALLASATSLFSYASPALAQVPVFQAEREPEPAPPAPLPAAPPAPAPVPELPPAPAAPPGAAAAPSGATTPPGVMNPAPAKAAVITAPGAHRAAEARAEEEQDKDEGDDVDASLGRHWYGWQTLTADGVTFSALLAGAWLSNQSSSSDSPAASLTWFGLLGYELAPGCVHFAHRNPGRGFASFGLRLGMPLAGAFIGASLASGCNTNLCEASGAGIGVLLGMGGAIAIDAAVFAYDDPKHPSGRRLGLLPLVSVTPHQAWIGVGGRL
jgi:hypothetical protein